MGSGADVVTGSFLAPLTVGVYQIEIGRAGVTVLTDIQPSPLPSTVIAAATSRTGAIQFAVVCRADFNQDGTVSQQDIFDFLNGWFASDPNADYNQNGVIETQDIFDFLNAWFVGCTF